MLNILFFHVKVDSLNSMMENLNTASCLPTSANLLPLRRSLHINQFSQKEAGSSTAAATQSCTNNDESDNISNHPDLEVHYRSIPIDFYRALVLSDEQQASLMDDEKGIEIPVFSGARFSIHKEVVFIKRNSIRKVNIVQTNDESSNFH
jgi:hypothetical protein